MALAKRIRFNRFATIAGINTATTSVVAAASAICSSYFYATNALHSTEERKAFFKLLKCYQKENDSDLMFFLQKLFYSFYLLWKIWVWFFLLFISFILSICVLHVHLWKMNKNKNNTIKINSSACLRISLLGFCSFSLSLSHTICEKRSRNLSQTLNYNNLQISRGFKNMVDV